MSRRIPLASPDETAALARALAPHLAAGDAVLLAGPIGAGKTAFARALIQERLARAGRWEEVPSPSFTLVQTYDDGADEIWHVDLYRLEGGAEAGELGLDEAFRTAICLVEWPDRLGRGLPAEALMLTFEIGDGDMRLLTASGTGARGAALAKVIEEVRATHA